MRAYLLGLQDRIISAFEAEDGKPFIRDAWVRGPEERLQGDGCSRLVEEGNLLERGGCNFSHVKGPSLPPSATQHRPELAGRPFEAMGVSLVFHPRNPYVPTVHMNVRMLAAHKADGTVVAETTFSATSAAGTQQVSLGSAAGFSHVELSAGAYDGTDFVFGGYQDGAGHFGSAITTDGAGIQHGSDFLVDWVEFDFPIVGVPLPHDEL